MKKFFLVLSMAILGTIALSACKKDKPASPEPSALVGSWSETPATPNFQRTLFFSAEGTFTMHFTYLGQVQGAETITGTYTTSGEKLNILALKHIYAQPNKVPVTLITNPQLYDQATYQIKGNSLTLNYLTYPADAPVKTTTSFLKN